MSLLTPAAAARRNFDLVQQASAFWIALNRDGHQIKQWADAQIRER